MTLDLVDVICGRLDVAPEHVCVLAQRNGRVVCRVESAGGTLAAKISTTPGDFAEEALAITRLAAIGVPVSDIVIIEDGPPAFIVTTWAEGEAISAQSDPAALSEVGRILRRIHQMPASAPFSGHPTVQAWIEHWFGLVRPWWESTVHPAPELLLTADAWIREIQPLLANLLGETMLFDGRPEHFILSPDGHLHLIDVADLQPGLAAMDLAVLELDAPGILEPVLAGYGPTADQRERFQELIPFLVLLRALSAAEWQGRVLGNVAESRRYLEIARSCLQLKSAQ